jgi:glycosyltransferase involved in cell wall biosynthesis
MPAFNDGKLIGDTIKTVLNQTYSNWELLIMDDGSTDDTANIIHTFEDPRIHFFQQENKGQLVALNNLCKFITGDLVLLLHSDDRLYHNDSLEKNLNHFDDPKVDGIFSSMVQFFDSGLPDSMVEAPRTLGKKAVKKLAVLLGSNIIMDHFFVRREKFESHVRINYFKWYIAYWLDFRKDKVSSLNLKRTETPWYHYRVYDLNYTNSVIGNFEVYFTRFRTIFFLSEYFTIPFPHIQKELTRRLGAPGFIIDKPASNKNLAKSIKANIHSMQLRTPNAFTAYFELLHKFYDKSSNQKIYLKSPIVEAYSPAEARKFFFDLKNESLVPLYSELISKLSTGFKSIAVANLKEKETLTDILKFLCIKANIIVE